MFESAGERMHVLCMYEVSSAQDHTGVENHINYQQ